MIDLFILLTFVVYCISNGFRNRKVASKNLEEYFLGGRTLKGWQAGISMAATQFAADTPLLITGLIATAGVFSLWRIWIYALAFLLMGFILGPLWRNAKVLTDAEFTELRYAGSGASFLRVLKAIYMGTVVNCAVMAMVLVAAVRIAEPFLLWHIWLPAPFIDSLAEILKNINFSITSVPADDPLHWTLSADNFISIGLIVTFTTLYSMTGGLRSVVSTDVMQFSLAMIATLCYACIIISHVGGFSGLGEQLSLMYGTEKSQNLLSFLPQQWDELTFVFLIVISVQWFAQVNADGTGYLAQRTMACQTDKDAKQAAVIFTFAQIVLRSLLWLIIGAGLLVLYPAPELSLSGELTDTFRMKREMTFVFGMRDILPVGIKGLMLTGMLAALASTIDTHLNWGSSYWTNDLYKGWLMQKVIKREPTGEECVWVARISNVIILLIATIVMVNLGSIQGAWHLTLLFGSGLGVVLILRWLWHRINLWSEITAILVSLILSFVLLNIPGMEEGTRLLIMLGVSTVAVLLVTYLTPPESEETLIAFYRRVRPIGFWGPIAKNSGISEKNPTGNFYRAAGATVLCALSVFLILAGCGHFLLNDLGKNNWFSFSLLLTIIGVTLIPVWVKYGFNSESLEQD